MKTNFTILCLLFFASSLFSQDIVDGQLIVRLKQDVKASSFFEKLTQNRSSELEITSYKTFSDELRLSLVKFDHERVNKDELIKNIASYSEVEIVGSNFRLEKRTKEPNDPEYTEQWGLDKIRAPEVWDCSTGGVTPLGDTIVVANLESCDIEHEDLAANIWVNHNEIPYDGIDNDGNSYVDDYYGFNFATGNDFHDLNDKHGTQTAGIIGAVGDNGIGVSGVAWNVKLMIVGNNLQFDQIISSYAYVLKQRTLYNQTNGEKGAFVVATNASFGAPGFPEDNVLYPPWCEMYDLLGAQGVLSAGATANSIINIDEKGDMPTSCESDYLVAVTEISQNNALQAGYSETMVDIGGPGSYTTEPNNTYGFINGTSAASPHIAGSIAVLYGMPCDDFAQLSHDDPAQAALNMKSYLLNGAAPLESLEGMTKSGGLMDLKGSMDEMQEACGSPTGNLDILNIYPNPVRELLTIDYRTPDNTKYDVRIFDALGRMLYSESVEPLKFEAKQIQVDVNAYPAGTYMISIENVSNIVSAKFVVAGGRE